MLYQFMLKLKDYDYFSNFPSLLKSGKVKAVSYHILAKYESYKMKLLENNYSNSFDYYLWSFLCEGIFKQVCQKVQERDKKNIATKELAITIIVLYTILYLLL